TLFPVRDSWIYVEGDLWGPAGGAQAFNGDNFWYAENPPFGAVFSYVLRDGLQTQAKARRKGEIEIEKEGGDTPYPSWETLRAEDREDEPAVLFIVRDAAGNVVRRLTGPSDKGLHRVAWDLRYPSPDAVRLTPPPVSPFGNPPVGPLVVPGAYSVTLAKRVNGVVTLLSEPQTFTLKPLHNTPEASSDRDLVLAFQQDTAELARVVSGATDTAKDLRNRLAHLKLGAASIDTDNASIQAQIQALETQLDDVDVALTGDRTISRRNEPAPWSIAARISQIRGWGWYTQAPTTGSSVDALTIAKTELDAALRQMRTIETGIAQVEQALEDRGAPFTAGRGVPDWRLED
ncbi:MAG: glycosyl hydrolase, partial [Pseudomonadota bacterium]